MSKPGSKSLVALYQRAWEQFSEDRKDLKSVFDELKAITSTKEDYAINGQNLAKFVELRIKNTSSLIELVKLSYKESDEKDTIGDEDLQVIHREIEKETKKQENEPS